MMRLGRTPQMEGLEPRLLLSGQSPLVTIQDVPAECDEGSAVVLTSLVEDADVGQTYTYAWSATRDGDEVASGTQESFEFTPDNDGQYAVSLVVTDSGGEQGADSVLISVLNVAPVVELPSGGGTGATPLVGGEFSDGLGIWWTNRPDLVQVVDGELVLSVTNHYVWDNIKEFWDFGPGSEFSAMLQYQAPEIGGAYAPDGTTGLAFDASVAVTSTEPIPAGDPGGRLTTYVTYHEVGAAADVMGIVDLFDGAAGTQEVALAELDITDFISLQVVFMPGLAFAPPGATDPTAFSVTTDIVLDNYAWIAPGGPEPVSEGDTVSLTPTVTDPGAEAFMYEWVVTRDGTTVATGSDETLAFTPDDDGAYEVTVTVTDDGASASDTTTIVAVNVDPAASIEGASATSEEGTEIALSATVTDPGSADTFMVDWVVTKDGAPFAAGTDATFAFTPDDNGAYEVTLVVTDDDGGSGGDTATVTVTNVPPTASITGVPDVAEEGMPVVLTAAVADPGTADTFTHAWTVSKDGVPVAAGSDAAFAFTPAELGVYSVSLTVTDDDGGGGAAAADVLVVRFLEQEAAVRMEAEAFTDSAPGTGAAAGSVWTATTDLHGFGGASALIALPNAGVNVGDTTAGPRLDYEVYFETPGTYYVWARLLGGGSRDDSIHVGLNGVPVTYGSFGMTDTSGFWNWEEKVVWRSGEDRVTVEVAEAGLTTVNVWMREDGTGLDGLILTQDADFVPDPLIPVATGAGPFVEAGGYVEMEAEAFTAYAAGLGPAAESFWQETTDLVGSSGAGAMIALPDANVNMRDSDIGPRLDYAIDFATPGTYYVWVRMLGTRSTSDSIHVGLDGVLVSEGQQGISDRSGVWHWEEKVSGRRGGQRLTVEVAEAGVHTVNVWMREDGVAIDKVLLTQDEAFAPDPLLPVATGRAPAAEENGFVEIEAEEPTAIADGLGEAAAVSWVATTTVSGFSGTGAMVATPDNELNLRDSDIGPRLDYDVLISTPGTYYVWVRMLGANARDDSLHLGVNGDPLSYGRQGVTDGSGVWHWEDRVVRRNGEDRVSFEVADAGVVTLNLWMREDGTVVDEFILTTDAEYVPDPLQPVATGLEAYEEADGYVEFEAEGYTASAAGLGDAADVFWEESTDMEGYSGDAAMVAGPNRGLNMRDADVGPRLDYAVNFTTTGTFYVWVRMLGETARDDSIHVGLDGEIASDSGTGVTDHSGDWHWEELAGGTRVTIEVTEAGVHTFNLWMREDGTYVDKFILTTDADFTPLD